MTLPTKIKLVFVTLAIIAFSQDSLGLFHSFFILAVISLLIFVLMKFFFVYLYKKEKLPEKGLLSFIHPAYGPLFLWLPLLFFLLFVRLFLLPEALVPPEGWYVNEQVQQGRQVYARASIRSVFKPGTYLAEVQMFAAKKRFNKKEGKSRKKAKVTSPPIPVYLKINDYYLVSGCKIWLRLANKKNLPKKVPTNSFGNYLERQGRGQFAKTFPQEYIPKKLLQIKYKRPIPKRPRTPTLQERFLIRGKRRCPRLDLGTFWLLTD